MDTASSLDSTILIMPMPSTDHDQILCDKVINWPYSSGSLYSDKYYAVYLFEYRLLAGVRVIGLDLHMRFFTRDCDSSMIARCNLISRNSATTMTTWLSVDWWDLKHLSCQWQVRQPRVLSSSGLPDVPWVSSKVLFIMFLTNGFFFVIPFQASWRHLLSVRIPTTSSAIAEWRSAVVVKIVLCVLAPSN